MASNINVPEKLKAEFDGLVHGHKYRAVIAKITPDFTSVEVESTLPALQDMVDPGPAYKEMVDMLPEHGCRYILYDFQWQSSATITHSKVILILWSSETSKVREKMIYASSQECILNAVPDIQRQVQATDEDEISYPVVLKRITS
ncbi:Cofilin [Porphyridium purpureum]|uniref:Cofilin n=1 Tax=Porphyridium purpureum TaxID=35688 RepID=A0A5J4Z6P4_PORPP|nr:Cofilin [Porphyridium purpureum]|eukprot:POR4885..scf295_1